MAAIPFGFSFGDFVAGANLIADVAKALRAAGGASSEYQAVAAELESLDRVLQRIAGIKSTTNHDNLDTIRALVLQCHFPLRQFLKDMQKFEISLGAMSNRNAYSNMSRKAQWALSVSKKVEKLKAAIGPQLVTINALLELQVLENQSRIESQQGDLLNRAVTLNRNVEAISKMMDTNSRAIMNILEMRDPTLISNSTNAFDRIAIHHEYSQTEHIVDTATQCPIAPTDVAEARKPMSRFGLIVAGKLITRRNIAEVLHELLRTIASRIQKLLFMLLLWYPAIQRFYRTLRVIHSPLMLTIEDNIQFEDAFGELKLLSYDYFRNWELFESFLKHSFKGLPGEAKVRSGQFYLINYRLNNRVIKRDEWETSIVPGSHISMSMIFSMSNFKVGVCPRPNCKWNNDILKGQEYTTCAKCSLTYFLDKDPFESSLSSWEHLPSSPSTPHSTKDDTVPSDNRERDSHIEEVGPPLTNDDNHNELQMQVFKKVHIRSDISKSPHVSSIRDGLKTKKRKLQVAMRPDSTKVRTWTDRSGQFQTVAQFLGCYKESITLHKLNGVLIEVPEAKISVEDLKYIGAVSETGTHETKAQIRAYPDPAKIRSWISHSGSVQGQFLGFFTKEKFIIHSQDGDLIRVLLVDISVEDIEFIAAIPEAAIAEEGTDHIWNEVTGRRPQLPDLAKLRTWTDRSGVYKVEAQFLRCEGGKIHLHKSNGVKIAVPMQRISAEDVECLASLQEVD